MRYPHNGYRAVHIHVDFPAGKAEIQIRTPLQAEWANAYEIAADIFDIEGKLSAIDFDDPDRWRVDTVIAKRMATVEDEDFLEQVNQGLALSSDDTYMLKIREDKIIKNGRTQTKWTILEIHKRTVNPEEG